MHILPIETLSISIYHKHHHAEQLNEGTEQVRQTDRREQEVKETPTSACRTKGDFHDQ